MADRRSLDDDSIDERAARGLVGAGRSQIRRDQAMRVRDIDRPSDEDLDEAEAQVRVVHRNWQPPR